MGAYARTDAVPAEKLQQMASMDLALADFVAENALATPDVIDTARRELGPEGM